MTVETVTLTQTETVVATQGSGNVIETVDVPVVVVTGLLGSPGPQGPQGPQGIQGPQGTNGASSVSQLTDVNLTNLTDESVLVYETDVSQWIATTQIVTYQPSLRLENDWVETTIQGSMLQTGTYFIQLFANDTQTGVNGTNDNEYYSGIMSWYNGNTNSSVSMPTDEIALHRAGAGGEGGLFLRTYRSPTGDSRKLRLQIYSNTATTSPVSYTFKFKRIM
jgi:hypothetical protein